jgi:hypothetical protein
MGPYRRVWLLLLFTAICIVGGRAYGDIYRNIAACTGQGTCKGAVFGNCVSNVQNNYPACKTAGETDSCQITKGGGYNGTCTGKDKVTGAPCSFVDANSCWP